MKSILTKSAALYFGVDQYLPWHSWHNLGFYILAIVLIVGVLIPIIVYRKNIMKLMEEAENSALTETFTGATADFIQRFQDSDMDDRMVYVIARLITKLPIVNLLVPTPVLAKVLNFFVQSTFDRIKGLLKARANNASTKLDPNDVDEVIAHILGSVQHVVDKKYRNIIDPKTFMYEISKGIGDSAKVNLTLTQDHPDLIDSAVHQVIDTDKVVNDVLSSLDGFDVNLTDVTEDDIKNIVNKMIK